MKRVWVAVLGLVVCSMAACKKEGGSSKSSQDSLLGVVPQAALAAVLIRSDALKLLRQEIESDEAGHKELREYLVKRIGLDLTSITAAAVFVTAPDLAQGAVFLSMPGAGAPKWEKAGDAQGTAIYRIDGEIMAAVVPTGLIIGTQAAVRATIATVLKKAPAVQKGSPLEALLEVDGNASLVAAVSVKASSDQSLRPLIDLYGVETAVAGYGARKLFVWAAGDPGRLATARDAAKGFIDLGLAQAQTQREEALAGDNTLLGVAGILGYRQYVKTAPKLTPRLEGRRLIVDYVLPEEDGAVMLPMAVATVGVLAAVAIPAFMKYIRRSKTVEATMNLRRLFDGEVSYWELHQGFAPSTDWTPSGSACVLPGAKFQPDPKNFADATFTALSFSIDDPFYYQYRVLKQGNTFVVEARGDLDCDGQFSLFRRTGSITPDGTNVTGGPGLYSENDIE